MVGAAGKDTAGGPRCGRGRPQDSRTGVRRYRKRGGSWCGAVGDSGQGGAMSAIADSRGVVLERIRAATRNSGPAELGTGHAGSAAGRDYIRRGSMTAEARLERMAERLREDDAEVVECPPEGLAATIQAQLRASGRRTFVAPAGLQAERLAPGFTWKIDGSLTVDEIERADGVLTACFCGVAE